MTQATSSFSVMGWEEKTWNGKPSNEVEGDKLTHAIVQYIYSGDLEGTSELHYLMTYGEDRSTLFIGLEHFTGKISGQSGSFVLKHEGKDENDVVSATFEIVPGSATGEFAGITGQGSVRLEGHQESYPHTLNYHLPSA